MSTLYFFHLNFTQLHFTTLHFTPFQFPTAPFHLTSLHFTSLQRCRGKCDCAKPILHIDGTWLVLSFCGITSVQMLINATNITFLLCASNWNRCLPSLTSVLDGDQHHAPGGFAPWYKALIVYWVCPSAFLGTFKEINNSLPHSQPNKISSYTQFVAWPLYRLSYPASLISVGCVILFSFHLLLRLSSVLLH